MKLHDHAVADRRRPRTDITPADRAGTDALGVRDAPAPRGVDWTRVITTAEVVLGAVLVARRLAARPAAAKASVTMGPGGWVSLKGGAMTVRPTGRGRRSRHDGVGARRPWWARLLRATPLDPPR